MDRTSVGRGGRLYPLLTCLALATPLPSPAASITATWLGGAGEWSDAARWTTSPSFPDGPLYDAVIPDGSVVAVDVPVAIQALTLADASLNVNSHLTLNEGGLYSGDISVAADSTLTMAGNFAQHQLASSGSVSGSGTISLVNGALIEGSWDVGGTTAIGGGAPAVFKTAQSSTAVLLLNGFTGGLVLDGEMDVGTQFRWTSGTLSGQGRLDVAGPSELSGAFAKVLDGHRLENRGVLSWTDGDLDLRNGAVFLNAAGGTVQASGPGHSSFDLGGDPSRFENEGDFFWDGFTSIQSRFDNRGLVSVTSGNLSLRGGGTSSGRFEISTAAELGFAAPSGASHDLLEGSAVVGEGAVAFGSFIDLVPDGPINVSGSYSPAMTRVQGEATVNFATLTGDFPGSLELTGNSTTRFDLPIHLVEPTIDANLVVEDELRLNGLERWAGEISGGGIVRASGQLSVGEFGRLRGITFENSGNAVQGPLITLEDARFRNLEGATYEGGSFDSNIFGAGASVFENLGTFRRPGGGSTFVSPEFVNSGTLELVGSSTLEFASSFRQVSGRTVLLPGTFPPQLRGREGLDFEGGTLEGVGTILADVRNGATTLPGGEDGFGRLEMNSLALLPTSELVFEIGGLDPGVEFDVIEVRIGNATLGGDLALELEAAVDEFSGQERLDVLTAPLDLVGAFANVASGERLTTRDGLGQFLVSYGPGSPFGADRVVLTDFLPVPEPSAGGLAALACGGLALLRRLRRA